MLEVVVAIVILAVLGFALHRATLTSFRQMETGKQRMSQIKQLEMAVDVVRSEACIWEAELRGAGEYGFVLFDGTHVHVVRQPGEADDPDDLLAVEVGLSAVDGAPTIQQMLLLDLGICR